jgi:hypothetical protein
MLDRLPGRLRRPDSGLPDLSSLREIEAAIRASPFQPFEHDGFCPLCEREVVFTVRDAWLRDNYLCSGCGSIPRERAIATVFQRIRPGAPALRIHESSPGPRGFSPWLRQRFPGLVQSHYWSREPPGSEVRGFRNENLEALTFRDASLDVHVTQDVMEHVFDLPRVASELYRTLVQGGVHIFTTPLTSKAQPTRQRARVRDGQVEHLVTPPAFHGNPIDEAGSLVTYDFGYDIVELIARGAPFRSSIWVVDDLWQGIRAEFNEVIVSEKP